MSNSIPTERTTERTHAGILMKIMGLPALKKNSKLLQFDYENYNLKRAYIPSTEQSNVNAVLNRPTLSHKIFITISNGDPNEVASVMAHLEHIDSTEGLHEGDVVRIDHSYMEPHGLVGVI